MKRSIRFIKKGTLVKARYSLEIAYGVTTSRIEYHAQNKGAYVCEYIWVLWDNGEHCLFKVDMLEIINESG